METLEVIMLEEWLLKLRKERLYNRKWWPDLLSVKEVLKVVRYEQPRWFFEIGTGNGITASFVAAAGFEVETIDIADRPKVYEDESFPLKRLKKSIHFFYNIPNRQTGKIVWFIDIGDGIKTITAIKKDLDSDFQQGDVVIVRTSKGLQVDKF
jgi:uncharacterized protein YqfB (UPF0267 family)